MNLRLQAKLPEKYQNATGEQLSIMIYKAKMLLGDDLFILGHHYQRDSIMQWADAAGDSFRLSVLAQERPEAKYIVFCGVHFMAESADILTSDEQTVILPDLNAGCSMADMADLDDVEEAWDLIVDSGDEVRRTIPITYMNSSAAIKAFVGKMGGAVCTSTNARKVLEWAFEQGDQVLFFPDQHLGRNTGYDMGYTADDMVVWDPRKENGGISYEDRSKRFILWKGHCTTHQRLKVEQIEQFRANNPDAIIVVHPECSYEVCEAADQVGSTDFIIRAIDATPEGAVIGVGTEINLVNRLRADNPTKDVRSLDPVVCPCSTMNRIDPAHLAWILEGLVDGKVRNVISVDPETSKWAKAALDRMLELI